MARARNIKPSFFRDVKIVSLPYETRLLFIGMWCLADYKGRFKYQPLELKMEFFAADEIDIQTIRSMVTALSESGLIKIYRERSGSSTRTVYVQVENFEKHQNPHKNEKKDRKGVAMPKCPDPADEMLCHECGELVNSGPVEEIASATVTAPEQHPSDPADSPFLIPSTCDSQSADGLAPDSHSATTESCAADQFEENENPWLRFLCEQFEFPKHQFASRHHLEIYGIWSRAEYTETEVRNAVLKARDRGKQFAPLKYLTTIMEGDREEGSARAHENSNFQSEIVLAAYHEALPDYPEVLSLEPGTSRYQDMHQRWTEDERHQTAEFWDWFFTSVSEDKYLMGEVNGFSGNLGYLLKKDRFIDIVEKAANKQESNDAA